jgi:plasmid replication initiation protein
MNTPANELARKFLLKHSGAVHSTSKLTATQKKIFNYFLYKAFPSILDDKFHSFKVSDLSQLLGWSVDSHINDNLKAALIGLTSETVKWNVLEKDRKTKWVACACLADVSIKDGMIYYSFGKFLREALHNPNIYAKIDLDIQGVLESRDSMILWEMVTEELSSKKTDSVMSPWLEWQKICTITSGEGSSYEKNYALYKSKVINKALLEINSKSGLKVTLHEKKEGRKVVQIAFHAVRLSSNASITNKCAQNTSESISLISSQLQILFPNTKKIEEACKKHPEDSLQTALDYYLDALTKQGEDIKNPVAFFLKALNEGWCTSEAAASRVKQFENEQGKTEVVQGLLVWDEDSTVLSIRQKIEAQFGPTFYLHWFQPARLSIENGKLIFKSSQFICDWVQNRFLWDLKAILKLFNIHEINFLVDEKLIA